MHSHPASPLRLLTWNVHKCRGGDGVRDIGRVLKTIADIGPDVAVLQEADLRFGRNRMLIDPVRVMEATGMRVCVPGAALGTGIGWRGNALLVGEGVSVLSSETISLPSLEPRGAAIWRVTARGSVFEVVGVHLGLLSVFRAIQAAHVAKTIASRECLPTVVAGDTNDWRSGSQNLRSIELVLGAEGGRHRTFPARRPILALDRIFAGRGAILESSWTAEAQGASDHLPLVSSIRLPGHAAVRSDGASSETGRMAA